MKHLKVKFAVRISIAKIREGELEKILQSIIIEFFRRQDSVLYETTWFDLFVISRPQLRRHCFARVPSSLAYRYPPPALPPPWGLDSAPFREYGWQAAGIKTLQAVFRAVAPKVSPVLSAQHPRAHAEPDCTNGGPDLRKYYYIRIYRRIDPLLKISP